MKKKYGSKLQTWMIFNPKEFARMDRRDAVMQKYGGKIKRGM